MTSLRRFSFMIITNLAIFVTIAITVSVLMKVFGLEPYLQNGMGFNYGALFVFCLLWGMVGAFASLLLSKTMAKWTMKLRILNPQSSQGPEGDLVRTVHNLAKAAGLPKMPEVAIYDSPEVNAFATGPSKRNSLVAVSTGLLHSMNRSELEGVLGHEVAHIANGDMVTMTLVQGIVNAFVMFFAKIVAWAAAQALSSRSEDSSPNTFVQFGIEMVLYVLFGFLGAMVVGYVSRAREFRADAGSARLAGQGKMIAALEALRTNIGRVDTRQESLKSMKISGGRVQGLAALMATHPPLELRIARLRTMS